jgi:hypothetical protein
MGYITFMEKNAQRQMLKRAMEASWTASNCIGMVLGPLSIGFEVAIDERKASRPDVEAFIDDCLEAWQVVRRLSDRNLRRNREYYAVRPNLILSPILLSFEQNLESIRYSPDLDSAVMLTKFKDAYISAISQLHDFNTWAKSAGALIGFDSDSYEAQAVRRGQQYWQSTVRQLVGA